MSNSIPEDWEIVPFGEFCLGVRGVSYKPDDLSPVKGEHTVTLLRSNNIQSGRMVLADVQNVSQTKVSKKQLACEGDVAVCMSNGSKRLVGKSAVFRNIPQGTKYTVGAFCSIFRPLESTSSGFVAQLLSSDQFRHQVDFSLAGSAINNLKNSDVIEYQFLKPPLPEQQKIAVILSSVDDVIEKTRAQIDKLKDLKTGIMQELLTRGIGHSEFKDSPVGRIPASWKTDFLGNLAEFVNGNSFKANDWSESGYPIIRIQNLNGDGNFNYYNKEVNPRWLVDNGDLLFAWSGQRGKSFGARIWKGSTGVLNQHIFKVNVNDCLISKGYLHLLMQQVQVDIERHAHGFKDSFMHVKKSDLVAQEVALPPLNEQKEIVQAIGSLQGKLDSTSKKLEAVLKMKRALMQDLLTGKVRVNLNQKESAVA